MGLEPGDPNLPGTLAGGSTVLTVPGTGKEIIFAIRAADGRIVFMSVPRRLFLQGLGSTAVGLTMVPMTTSTPGATSLPADVNPIEHFQQMRQVLIESDSLFGPQHVIPAVQKQINIIQQLRETEPHSPCGTGWLDETFIAVQRARSTATVGDHHSAAESFRHAIPVLPPRYRRGRGLWLARAAIAETGDQDVERATSLGLEALAIGAETGSAQILSELAQLENALAPWQTVPAVADFRTAMKDTLVHRD